MTEKNIVTQILEKVNGISESQKAQVIEAIDKQQEKSKKNFKKLIENGENLKKETNRASLLLGFRRFIEMLLRVDTILAVENIYDKKNFAISSENIIFYLDRRYYSDFKVISFMDIFKIETSNYKRLYWYNENLPPHLGLILKYVESHYNTTYRFFTNRNLEYHCIYTILYQLNSEIKEIINILNSYHYLTDEESLKLYNISFEEVYKKIDFVLEKIEKFLSLVL